ncbi:fumarylacetoacetate hydrolase domain-containing protein 2 [Rhizoctonia solani]|uniref:Fumarylacetoacetate hydrolase domain-containing protein 2 n=1 Tax=Rhizoctonia solani TaxID=456999 RepID=A0A8H8NNB3_9AGAM|nr:fumarylacetoacetate hydrolase domain-containing protein 2 [Rhizoctonia solani]QRW15787.1 fumarylacetoacetate hydrolase domain-containing protein 2 [Rhizoctonia solani]
MPSHVGLGDLQPTTMSKAKPTDDKTAPPAKEYRYATEISQMMFVFGEVQDPLTETVNLVEDIVRGQVVEILIQARQLAARKGARNVSPEDLIFLIRYDRGKVNRLRTYLGWKDVRKNAKQDGDGAGAAEVDIDEGQADEATAKPRKMTVKLPWDIVTVYSEVLRTGVNVKEDEDEDEDEVEAHEDSIARLREADEATRRMTREEYVHYSECRSASFTYRKAKRFREFINLPAYLDIKPNDDTIDILGFLAFEMVRALCVGGLAVKRALEESYQAVEITGAKRKAPEGAESSPGKRRRRSMSPESGGAWGSVPGSSLFLPPPEARRALRPAHIQEAFAKMQRDWAHQRGSGMRNWRAVETGGKKVHIGQPVDAKVDVGLAILKRHSLKAHEISGSSALDPDARVTSNVLTVDTLLEPIAPEQIGFVRCLGLNYRDHAAEAKMPIPEVPVLFCKPYTSLIPALTPIRIPRAAQPVKENLSDYEVELAVVIGKDAKDVKESEALDYVLGYTGANDVSFRKHQLATSQWTFSKSFDLTNPIGPALVRNTKHIDPQNIPLTATVNSRLLQDGTTADQIFGVAKTIAFLSQGTTLKAGSVILTGTPAGVGFVREPKIWLNHGDEVRTYVGAGIGTLVNKIVEEGRAKL